MYKLKTNPITKKINYVHFFTNNIRMCIPLSSDNADYQHFKTEILEGAELQDADGNTMSPQAAQDYVRSLP